MAAEVPAISQAEDWHLYYFKQRKPLTIDPARILVFERANVAAAAVGWGDYGLDDSAVRPSAIRGRTFVGTGAQHRNSQSIESSVRRLAAANVVDFVSPVFLGKDGGPMAVTPTILVRFNPGVTRARAEAILAEHNAGRILDRDWAGMKGAYRVRSALRDGVAVLDTANRLAQRAEVRWAEPDMMFTGTSALTPNDPLFGDCWGLHNVGQLGGTPDADMDAPEAWDVTTGDPSIKVLIIDTGIEQTHPDINQVAGMDFTGEGGGGGPNNECDNHGTAVGGCVSAIINNNLGTVGVAPGTKVASARPFVSNIPCSGGWSADFAWTVDALAWGESIGARVTNNSNFYGAEPASVTDKYEETRDGGMVHFGSAGNFSSPNSTYPASLPTVNSIAALHRSGNRAGFSNFGADIFVSAPGQEVMSTDRTGSDGYYTVDYGFVDGTSFASPYTAGVAALVLSINPARPPAAVESILASTAVDLGFPGFDTDFGWGFVNAHNAVQAALDVCDDPGPPDCNFNGVKDSCDIFEGFSSDCNSNAIPDDCESAADCQPNGVRDICEIGQGLASDCNGNTVLDECELAGGSPDCQPNGYPDDCDTAGVGSIVSDRLAVYGYTGISGFGTPLNLADDTSGAVIMPFVPAAFAVSSILVSNNGYIRLTGGDVANPNTALPNAGFGSAMLVFWDDLDATTGNVYHATVGTSPNRRLIVEWHNRPEFPGDAVLDGDEGTFQVQIFETPIDEIVAQYLYADTDFDSGAFDNGRSATVGYHRSSTEAIQWSFNTAGSVSPSVTLSLLLGDRNENGRPDDCDPSAPTAVVGDRPRSVALIAPAASVAAAPTALRVRMVDVQNPQPPNAGCCPPPDFSAYEAGAGSTDLGDCVRWVGPSAMFLEAQDTPASGAFRAARLQCSPYYHDWGSEGLVQVLGADVLPSSLYEVESLSAACMGIEDTCIDFSAPLRIRTTRHGDLAAPFQSPTPPLTQPNGIDVTTLVNKFRNLVGAPSKSVAQIQPNLPDLNADVNALDVTAVVDAFRGFAYPFSGPCVCPSTVMCGATPCTSAGQCTGPHGPGSLCVKTCSTGPQVGSICNTNLHCGQCATGVRAGWPCDADGDCPSSTCTLGTCGSGTCRDRCGRCN
jgi:thermitase